MAPTRSDIDDAANRIAPLVRTTPVLTVPAAELGVDPTLEATISLKLELLQHSGSFKARGATNFLRSCAPAPDGVVAASGGNHGAAVAWAARELGVAANIFVPTISAEAKVARLRSYGATVHQVGAVYAEALAASEAFLAEHDATAVHAYEADLVIAGAGNNRSGVRKRRSPNLDAVLVACGGGGLVSGVATWFGDRVTTVACETHGTPAFAQALAAGGPTPVEVSGIAADALGATSIGTIAWELLTAADACERSGQRRKRGGRSAAAVGSFPDRDRTLSRSARGRSDERRIHPGEGKPRGCGGLRGQHQR